MEKYTRKIALVWSIVDVKMVRPQLSREQCGAVLDATLEYHDATIGVTWDVLETHADMLFPMEPETENLVGKFNEEYRIEPDLTWKNVDTTWKRFLKEQKAAAANAGASA